MANPSSDVLFMVGAMGAVAAFLICLGAGVYLVGESLATTDEPFVHGLALGW